MKTITLIFLCLALTVVAVRAEDFHMVQTLCRDEAVTNTPNTQYGLPVVYVLLLPDNPVVFKTFDSKGMEQTIAGLVKSGSIPAGSVLQLDGRGYLRGPSDDQIKAFGDFCEKVGVKLRVSARL